jgi:hypothetical protein
MKTKIKIHYYATIVEDNGITVNTFTNKEDFKNYLIVYKDKYGEENIREVGKVIIDDEGLRTFPKTKNQKDLKDLIKYFKANKDIYELELPK